MPKGIYKRTEQQKEILKNHCKKICIGRKPSFGMQGKKMKEDSKLKISKSLKGKNTWLKGKPISIKHRKNISKNVAKGENCNFWKGGVTKISVKIRSSMEYKLWRESVFKRDDYTCVWCFKKGGLLNADHIKPFAIFPELRFAIDNGRTLCVDCHKKTDTFGSKTLNYKTK